MILLLNLPNILTLIRIILIPIFPLAYFYDFFGNGPLIAILIYILANLTDLLDGYVARKFNMVTDFGTVLDPLADKLMLICVLITLSILKVVPIIIVIIVTVKEIFMIISSIFLYFKKDKLIIPANSFGKISSASFFISILEVLIINNSFLNILLFSISIILAIIALISYTYTYKVAK